MPRVKRINSKIKFYHVLVQGIKRENIFKYNKDKEKYINLINKYTNEENVQILAYCVLKEHAHILMYSNEISDLSKVMQRVNLAYSRFYNVKYSREGFVFRNRFSSEPLETIEKVFSCIKFIHNSPIRNKYVKEIKKYKYSSYNTYENSNITINGYNYKDYVAKEGLNIKFIDITYKNNEKKVLEDFCKEKNISKSQLYESYKMIQEVAKRMKHENEMSIRAISRILNTSRDKAKSLVT